MDEREILDHLPKVKAPDAIWTSIEAALNDHRSPARRPWLWAFASVAVLALLAVGYWSVRHRAGEWIETDSKSRTTLRIGEIGFVEIEPGTRVRVVTEQPGAVSYTHLEKPHIAVPRDIHQPFNSSSISLVIH